LLFSSQLGVLFGGREGGGLGSSGKSRIHSCLTAELERIHSHLMYLGAMAHKMGFDTLFMFTWSGREAVMDMLELLSGNRVNYAINTLGGVRRDVDESISSQ